MIEIADRKSTDILDKHAVVYKHLTALYEDQWRTVFGKLNGAMRVMIFCQSFNELILMAQDKYLDNYYERIRRNAV